MATENLVPFPILTTGRLVLRQLLETDVKEIFSLRSDTLINKYLDRRPSITLDDALNFIRNMNANIKNSELKYWAIELKDSKSLIGTICLFDYVEKLKKCEIGYELLRNYQGQGIMTEAAKTVIQYAFQNPGLNTIDACTHKDNESSAKLLDKLKFQKTEIIDEMNPDLSVFRLTK